MTASTKQFPPQKELTSGSTGSRRDRGANSKRLPCTEAAVSAPIAAHIPEAHETLNPTRDGEGVPKVMRGGQLPGCLPTGYDLDSLLTVAQFAVWRQKSEDVVRDELPSTKGVISRNRKDVRIHPRTYLEKAMKGIR